MPDSAPNLATASSQPSATEGSHALSQKIILVKLLAAVAVIGLIASLVSIIINPVQAQWQRENAQRQQDLNDLRMALDNYATSHNGTYPSTNGQYWCEDCTYPDYQAKGKDNWIPELVLQKIIDHLPTDPANLVGRTCQPAKDSSYAGYVYYSPAPPYNTEYKLFAQCTPPTFALNYGSQAPKQPYCAERPPYDSSRLSTNPFRDVALKPYVDPARYEYGYAIYTPGLACL